MRTEGEAPRSRPAASGGQAVRASLLLMLLTTTASAQEEAPVLTLGWALDTARAQNPELHALAAERQAAWERVPQAWAFEDPTLGVQLWNFPFTRAPGAGSMIMYELGQPLPFPGKRKLRGAVAESGARVAAENVQTRENELIARVKRFYYQLWTNRAAREINRRNQQVLQQIRDAALALVATGSASISDVLRAETEIARLQTDLVSLDWERRAIAAPLNSLLGRRADAPLGEPVEFFLPIDAYSYDAVRDAAIEQRPELRAAGFEVLRSERESALARRNRWPDFMPSAMLMQDLQTGLSWGGTLGITVPLWIGQKQNRAVREADAMAAAARARQAAARLEVESDVRSSLAAFETAGVRVRLLRGQVIPKARAAFEAVMAGYATGRENVTALLDARRVLQDLELEYERTRAEAERARADLERAVGGKLPPR